MSEPNNEAPPSQPPHAAPAEEAADERTDSHQHPPAGDVHGDGRQPQADAPTQQGLPPVVPQGEAVQAQPAAHAPQHFPQAPYDQHQQPMPPLGPPDGRGPGQQSGHPTQQQGPRPAPDPVQDARQHRRGRHAASGNDELASAQLIRPAKRTPQSGWRKAVYVASGRLVNPGESPADRRRRELIARVNQPLRGCFKIAMLSLKGGVGKTTTTTTLGATFASLRGDRVVAIDANPDRGTLSQKIPMETTATVRHLLRDADRITRYSDIRAYTSQGSSRLEILASEQDPAVSEAFSEQDYRRALDLLEHFYNIVLTDCGTGLMHSAMKGVLDAADALVLVSSGSVDGARSASATLDWLDAHGYGYLVQRSVAVINSVRPKASSVDLDKLEAHFGARTRAVCRIPFDGHLEEGAEIELDQLDDATRLKLLELASAVADGFPSQ